jgi:hypothetical protein
MRMSKLVKTMLTYLPFLAVLVVTALGLWIGRDLYPSLFLSETNTPAQPRGLLSLGTVGPCDLSEIYTSFPPKCKMMDGSFIPADGIPPFVIMVTPEIK